MKDFMQNSCARNSTEYSAQNYVNISAKLIINFSVHFSYSSSIGKYNKYFMQNISARNSTEFSAENYVNISAKITAVPLENIIKILCKIFLQEFVFNVVD